MNEWLLLQSGNWIYLGLFLLLMGGAIGLPIPEDLPLILGGVLLQAGKSSLGLTFLVCYVAILLGDVLIYSVGRKFGPALFQKNWFRKRFSPRRIKRVRFRLERRSLLMIFIARHLFYLRTATFLVCGAVRMNFARFLSADALAALVSAPLMLSLGYVAAQHYERWMSAIDEVKYTLFFFSLAVGIIAAIVYRQRARKRQQPELEKSAAPQASADEWNEDEIVQLQASANDHYEQH